MKKPKVAPEMPHGEVELREALDEALLDPTLPRPPEGLQHTSRGWKPQGKVSDLHDE